MIDDVEQARRLARAILADIELYNAERARSPDPMVALAEPLAEGTELFRKRVAPGLQDVFRDVVLEWAAKPRDARADRAGVRRFALLFGAVIIVVAVLIAFIVARQRSHHDDPATKVRHDEHATAR